MARNQGWTHPHFLLALASYGICFVSCAHLVRHLEADPLTRPSLGLVYKVTGRAWGPLVWNALLALLFVLQHSWMALYAFKKRLVQHGVGYHLNRVLYSLVSCLTLLALEFAWETSPDLVWAVTNPYSTSVMFYLRCYSWLGLAASALTLDLSDLTGLKQTYHQLKGWGVPTVSSNLRTQRFNCRHPIFLNGLVVLLLIPHLTLDRVFLALGFTVYMGLGSAPTQRDVDYVYGQMAKNAGSFMRNLESHWGHLALHSHVVTDEEAETTYTF